MLLLNDCISAVEGVGLDPQMGFLHVMRPGRPSLGLDLMEELRPHLWVHGHLHHSVDYVCGGTRVLSNPRGYWSERGNENPSFDVDLVVDIDALPAPG